MNDKETALALFKEQWRYVLKHENEVYVDRRGGRYFGDMRTVRALLSLVPVGSVARVKEYVEGTDVNLSSPVVRVYTKVGFDHWTLKEEKQAIRIEAVQISSGPEMDLKDWLE